MSGILPRDPALIKVEESNMKNEGNTFTVTVADPDDLLSATTPKSNDKCTKLKYKQSFRYEWLEDPNLKSWLAPDPNNERRAKCKFCNKSLNAHKKDLIHHATTRVHCFHASNSEVTFETEDANITIITQDAENEEEAETIQIISQDPDQETDGAALLSQLSQQTPLTSGPPKQKRKYTKRQPKSKVKQEWDLELKSSGQGIAHTQSLQAVESLLGMDLTNTLRSFGDIEIHIPMDEEEYEEPNDNDDYFEPEDSLPNISKKPRVTTSSRKSRPKVKVSLIFICS